MATKTFQFNLLGRPFSVVKMAEKDAQRLYYRLRDLTNIHQFRREITGTIGGECHETQLMSLFLRPGEGHAPADPDAWQADTKALIAGLPDTITKTDAPDIIARAQAIFSKHVTVVDNRKTPEQITIQNQQYHELDERQKAEQAATRAAFIEAYCASSREIEVPDGYTAITLQRYFDDSHVMTDYFQSHVSLGYPMLLALYPEGAETEARASQAMRRFSELGARTWTWHTEKYSMGHGNYLQSDYFDTEVYGAYDGRDVVDVRYEIEFHGPGLYLPFRGYPGALNA